MREITKDKDTKTDIFIESQTIKYAINPSQFKEDLQKAKNEVEDLENAVKNTSRWVTSFYNVTGSRVEELGRQFKAGIINEEDLKEALRDVVKDYGKDVLEGRQDKKVAEDKSNDEEGLESLGRPANEYVKKRIDK